MFSKINQILTSCLLLAAIVLAGCTTTPATVSPTAAVEVPTVSEPAETSTSGVTDMGLIQFEPGVDIWYMPGTLTPNNTLVFAISATKGQQLTLWLATNSTNADIPLAEFELKDQSGQILTSDPVVYWSQVLPENQVYTIEVIPYAQKEVPYSLTVELPADTIDPAFGNMYEPLDASVCETLKQIGAEALATDMGLEFTAPFMDVFGGEAGQGCRIATAGYGTQFSSPQNVVTTLAGSMGLGWTEQVSYQADGPTGSAKGLTRDSALMLISASWEPDLGVECPADQPIENCELTEDQKFYTIEVTIAQYAIDFSLDGHWVDETTGFTLDLYQDWKNIYGQHEIVAQEGNKIDALESSITGMIQGEGAIVEFRSSFTDHVGTAELIYVDANTMQWRIITAPEGEYYFPAEATLKR